MLLWLFYSEYHILLAENVCRLLKNCWLNMSVFVPCLIMNSHVVNGSVFGNLYEEKIPQLFVENWSLIFVCPRQKDLPLSTNITPSDSRLWCWPSKPSMELHPSIYVQTLVRPHAPARALHSSSSAGRLVPLWLTANKACWAELQLFSVLARQW